MTEEVIPYYSPSVRTRFPTVVEEISGIPLEPENGQSPKAPAARIGYFFDREDYQSRVAFREGSNNLQKTVPEGWPTALTGRRVWSGLELKNENEFVYILTKAENYEVTQALKQYTNLGLSLEHDAPCPRNFPLPQLSQQLETIRREVYEGRGLFILRGLELSRYQPRDLATVYLGIMSYVAEVRGKQNQGGTMLIHVTDMKQPPQMGQNAMPYHTDVVCDCLSLLIQKLPTSGGDMAVASAWAIYNELAETRPDLIHTLAQTDWPFDTFGRDPPYYKRPVLFFHNENIIINFSRRLLCGEEDGNRSKNIPGLTEAQAEALDAIHAIATQHECMTSMQEGDIRIINNLFVLHRREKFVDPDNMAQRRHLLRLWSHNVTHCWNLPDTLKPAWARVFADDDREEKWFLDVDVLRNREKEGGKPANLLRDWRRSIPFRLSAPRKNVQRSIEGSGAAGESGVGDSTTTGAPSSDSTSPTTREESREPASEASPEPERPRWTYSDYSSLDSSGGGSCD